MPMMYRFACTLRASAEARNPADCRQHSRAAGHYSIYGLDAPGSASTGQEGDAKGKDGDTCQLRSTNHLERCEEATTAWYHQL